MADSGIGCKVVVANDRNDVVVVAVAVAVVVAIRLSASLMMVMIIVVVIVCNAVACRRYQSDETRWESRPDESRPSGAQGAVGSGGHFIAAKGSQRLPFRGPL